MNNLDMTLKIFELRLSILNERYDIDDMDENTYGFQLKKLDNELKEMLDSIKEKKDE